MTPTRLLPAVLSTVISLPVLNADHRPRPECSSLRRLTKLSRWLGMQVGRRFQAVQCEGTYAGHLQGVCTNGWDTIYWSFTDTLAKTDLKGRVVKQVAVASHHGDLCYVKGRIYVAVNLGAFTPPSSPAT